MRKQTINILDTQLEFQEKINAEIAQEKLDLLIVIARLSGYSVRVDIFNHSVQLIAAVSDFYCCIEFFRDNNAITKWNFWKANSYTFNLICKNKNFIESVDEMINLL